MHTIEFLPNISGKHNVELLPIHFGQILVHADDQVIRRIIMNRGSFDEPQIIGVTNLFETHFNFKPEIFVDIGANIGTHSIFAIKSEMYKEAIAIEPDPRNFKLLVMNSILNSVHNKIQFSDKAVSNEIKEVEFELSPNNLGDHRVVTEFTGGTGIFNEKDWNRIKVQADLLDNIIPHFLPRENTLVWIDVQGHEGHLFEGAKRIFHSKSCPYIVTEFYPYGLIRSGGLSKFFEFLETRSKIINISNPNWETTNLTVDILRELAMNTSMMEWHLDLLLIP